MTPLDIRQKLGKFYRPRRPVTDKMCASCPFGVETKFEAKLKEFGDDLAPTITSLAEVQQHVDLGMEFLCHGTVEHDMNAKTSRELPSSKMCRGAFMYKRGEI